MHIGVWLIDGAQHHLSLRYISPRNVKQVRSRWSKSPRHMTLCEGGGRCLRNNLNERWCRLCGYRGETLVVNHAGV